MIRNFFEKSETFWVICAMIPIMSLLSAKIVPKTFEKPPKFFVKSMKKATTFQKCKNIDIFLTNTIETVFFLCYSRLAPERDF